MGASSSYAGRELLERPRPLMVPAMLENMLLPRSASSSSSSVGNRDMPNGGWGLDGVLIGGAAGVGGCDDIVGARARKPAVIVLRLLKPSHSYSDAASSLIGAMLSAIFSSCNLFNSSVSILKRALERRRTIAAVPRIASALGSDSGCSCSAMVWIWSRSPLKTAASGTSLADLESCSRTTPEQIVRKPRTTVTISGGVPLKPLCKMIDVSIVVLVK